MRDRSGGQEGTQGAPQLRGENVMGLVKSNGGALREKCRRQRFSIWSVVALD